MYYKCHKINSTRGGSYIDSPDWIKNKKATVNLINKKKKKATVNPINKKDNICFQCAVRVALNYEEI